MFGCPKQVNKQQHKASHRAMVAELFWGFLVGAWSYVVEGEGKSLVGKRKR